MLLATAAGKTRATIIVVFVDDAATRRHRGHGSCTTCLLRPAVASTQNTNAQMHIPSFPALRTDGKCHRVAITTTQLPRRTLRLWNIRVRLCIPVLQRNSLHRWKTFNAAHYRLLPATSHMMFKLTSLSERRDSLCSKLFRQLVSQSHILHCLLPEQRDDSLTGRLRSRNKYPTVRARTNRFKNSSNNICSV